jgi:type IV pilus assembly protein PilQ
LWIAPKKEVPENLQALAIPLKYAKALDVVQRMQLTGSGAAKSGHHWLSARGTVMAEPRTNQLFFLDTPVYLKQMQEVIKRLDVPMRQVMIEARIVEAEEQFGKSLGVRLGGAFAAPFTAPYAANAKPVNMAISAKRLGSTGGVSAWLRFEFASRLSRSNHLSAAQFCHFAVQRSSQSIFKPRNFCT